MPVGEDIILPPCLTQCYKKPSLARESCRKRLGLRWMSSPFLNLYFYTSSASLKLGTFSRRRRLNFGSCLTIWCHLYDCRGDQRSSVIYKNIILFKKGLSCCFASLSVKFSSQTFRRRPLPVCAVFDILFVGATTMFSKKTCGLPSARPIF